MSTVEELWQERLCEARMDIGRGLQPEVLVDRYDADTEDDIKQLTIQATKEVIRNDNRMVTLDDLDEAERKLSEDGNYEIVTDGGQLRNGTERCWDHEECPRDECDGELQQQDTFNVMCLSCETVWSHWKDDSNHFLVTDGLETVARKSRVATDGGQSVDGTERPKRDVSARTAIGRCDHCGGHANSTLGGEHIWKCSEIVPIEVLEEFKELSEKWQDDAEMWLDPADKNVSDGERGAALQQVSCAEQIEDLVERYVDTDADGNGGDS